MWRDKILSSGGREREERSGCSAKVYSALVLWVRKKPSLNSPVNL